MRLTLRRIALIILLFAAICPSGCSMTLKRPAAPAEENVSAVKGAWIASVWNIDFPKNPTRGSESLKHEIDTIISRAVRNGLNTLFFQVRPCADALYKSEIFPWSRFLTGTYGAPPTDSFDPLDYITEQAHASSIELHAWVNPLRITVAPTDVNPFAELSLTVNENSYFDPANPVAIETIIQGVREIAENYDIDGIQYDDYFYPEDIDTQDYDSFLKYGNGFANIADWRRHNIDELIRQTHDAIKGINPSISFGVSPSGIWANRSSHPSGSDTGGFESRNAIYADSRNWVTSGFVDYIAPQIYWHIGQAGSDFTTVLNWWSDLCREYGVTLYVGLAGYKLNTGGVWNQPSEFPNQKSLSVSAANGYIIFSFSCVD